jgi:hypothetical protein
MIYLDDAMLADIMPVSLDEPRSDWRPWVLVIVFCAAPFVAALVSGAA